jgi:hypothetical protein
MNDTELLPPPGGLALVPTRGQNGKPAHIG